MVRTFRSDMVACYSGVYSVVWGYKCGCGVGFVVADGDFAIEIGVGDKVT